MSHQNPQDPPNDDTIEGSDTVYRRIRDDGVNIVDRGGFVGPSSAAFEDDIDGISVFLGSVLTGLGRVAVDVVDRMPGYRVAVLAVSEVRAIGLGITRDPSPADAPDHVVNSAHALIRLPTALSVKQRLKCQRRLARASSLLSY